MFSLLLTVLLAQVAQAQDAPGTEPTPEPAPATDPAPEAPAEAVPAAEAPAGGDPTPVEPTPVESAAPVADPPAPARSFDTVLDTAEALDRKGQREAARALAEWTRTRPDAGPAARQAEALLDGLPPGSDRTVPLVKVVAWEAATGAWLLGPNMAMAEYYGDAYGAYWAGSLLGGGLGAVGAVALARQPGFDRATVDALVGPQQLLAFNATVLASQSDDWRIPPAGLAVGALAGTGVGLAWALQDPHPVAPAGLRSGAWWGLGLTTVVMSYTYAFDDMHYKTVPLVLAAGTDVGAGIGLALPYLLPVTRDQVRMANLGGVVGAGMAYGFAWLTADIIWYTPHAVAAVVGGAGVAGGALGVVLATRLDHAPDVPMTASLLSDEGNRLRLGVPVPRPFLVPGTRDDLAWGVSLVDHRF